jgi:hypothetical protein
LQEFRHRYLFSYTPRGVPKGGWHELTVRVKRGTVKARPGYLGWFVVSDLLKILPEELHHQRP